MGEQITGPLVESAAQLGLAELLLSVLAGFIAGYYLVRVLRGTGVSSPLAHLIALVVVGGVVTGLSSLADGAAPIWHGVAAGTAAGASHWLLAVARWIAGRVKERFAR